MRQIVDWRFGLTTFLLGSAFAAVQLSNARAPESLARPFSAIPFQLGDWEGVDAPPPADEVMEILQPSSVLARQYRNEANSIDLFAAFYAQQRAGETMHSPKHCLSGGGWEVLQAERVLVPIDSGPVSVNQYLVQKGRDRLLMLYWYQTKNRVIASEYLGKLCLVWDAIVRRTTSGSIVTISLPADQGASTKAINLASQIIPEISLCFAETPDGL